MNLKKPTKLKDLTNRNYWRKFWHDNRKIWKYDSTKNMIEEVYAFDLILKYLKRDPLKTCIEIGCIPGKNLIAFNKILGYQVSGVDFCPLKETEENFKAAGIKQFDLFQEDFRCFTPSKKYDVVASFGYIEHFLDPEIHIEKMGEILKPNGILVMGLPNFRYVQYLLHRILGGKEKFKVHHTKIMDLKVINSIMKENNFNTIFSGYYKIFEYWHVDKSGVRFLCALPVIRFSHLLNRMIIKFGLESLNHVFTSRILSPYIMYIGRKSA